MFGITGTELLWIVVIIVLVFLLDRLSHWISEKEMAHAREKRER